MMKSNAAIYGLAVVLASALVQSSSSAQETEKPDVATSSVETQPVKAEQPVLEEVASFPDQQVTGVAVSTQGRIFVNFPFWSDGHTTSVAEVGSDGSVKPFPNEAWQAQEGDPAKRWVCVQSVFIDDTDALWVLDTAAPMMESVVKGGPKLVKFDLASGEPVQTIHFPETVLPARSYLNDVRIDTTAQVAYVTESGLGAIFVVDLKSQKIRRLLAEHPAVKAEPEVELVVDGIKLIDPKTGHTPQIHSDGIELSPDCEWLYFHALTGRTLYRIRTSHLRDEDLPPEELAKKVEKIATTSAPDGMLTGKDGSVYLAAFETNAIERFDPKTKKVEVVVTGKKLQWPDSMSWGPDGFLYVTISQIHRTPKFNKGEIKQLGPFQVLRFKPKKQAAEANKQSTQ
jgi:sugar lactone lactonase YvrE